MPTKKTTKPKPLTIEVTEDDIKKGDRGSLCNCPIARALKRSGATKTSVNQEEICWTKAGQRFYADVPDLASAFVEMFDGTETKRGARRLLKPFSFTVKPVKDVEEKV